MKAWVFFLTFGFQAIANIAPEDRNGLASVDSVNSEWLADTYLQGLIFGDLNELKPYRIFGLVADDRRVLAQLISTFRTRIRDLQIPVLQDVHEAAFPELETKIRSLFPHERLVLIFNNEVSNHFRLLTKLRTITLAHPELLVLYTTNESTPKASLSTIGLDLMMIHHYIRVPRTLSRSPLVATPMDVIESALGRKLIDEEFEILADLSIRLSANCQKSLAKGNSQ